MGQRYEPDAEIVARIAAALGQLNRSDTTPASLLVGVVLPSSLEGSAATNAPAKRARAIYKARRFRNSLFSSPDLFGEPAWDILLDLFASEAEGKTVSVSSACIAADVPASTGLRWISVLEENGLLVREKDRFDQRQSLLKLTPAANAAMTAYCRPSGPSEI